MNNKASNIRRIAARCTNSEAGQSHRRTAVGVTIPAASGHVSYRQLELLGTAALFAQALDFVSQNPH